jgi:plasmid stabilization system protein ParE
LNRPVFWSGSALDDLEASLSFIASRSPAAARKILALIRKTGNDLGKVASGRQGRVPGTYEKLVPGVPYIIAYAIGGLPEGGERIVVLRAIHGARHWPKETWPA